MEWIAVAIFPTRCLLASGVKEARVDNGQPSPTRCLEVVAIAHTDPLPPSAPTQPSSSSSIAI